MQATADLRSEHGGVGRMLRIMEGMALRIDGGALTVGDDLGDVIEFLRVFVDQCHHSKEELLLFPALHDAHVATMDDTIAALLDDHARGRGLVAKIAGGTEWGARHEAGVDTQLAGALREYASLLRDHIHREETDCFERADAELPHSVQDELQRGYDQVEEEVVGAGRHEAFHALLDRLAIQYL